MSAARQLDLGGIRSRFVYFDGAGLHDFLAPSGNQGRPCNPNSCQDRDEGLPLVLGMEFGIRDIATRLESARRLILAIGREHLAAERHRPIFFDTLYIFRLSTEPAIAPMA